LAFIHHSFFLSDFQDPNWPLISLLKKRPKLCQGAWLGKSSFGGEIFISLAVNPVRNFSGALNPAGIILKSNPAAEQRGIISNGVNL